MSALAFDEVDSPSFPDLSEIFPGNGEMAQKMRAMDWAATPLGPPAGWPIALQTAVGIMLSSDVPMCIAWGRTFAQLYNDAWRPMLGDALAPLGSSLRHSFRENWAAAASRLEQLRLKGGTIVLRDQQFPHAQECNSHAPPLTLSCSAIRGGTGEDSGIFITARGAVVGAWRKDGGGEAAPENTSKWEGDLLRRMTEDAPVMIWASDLAGRCVHINRMLRSFWNVENEALPDFDWSRTLHPEDLPTVFAKVKSALETQSNLDVEARYRDGLGRYRTLRTEARPRYAATGEFLGMIGVNVDVTDTVRANEQMRASEERLRIATDSAGLGIFEWHVSEDRAIFENDRMFEIYGVPREYGGVSRQEFLSSFVHPEDVPILEAKLQEGMQPGATFHAVYRIRRKSDNELRWLSSTGNFSHKDDGTPLRMVGVTADITEQKKAEEALRESEARLRQLADTMPQLAWYANPDGYITWHNERWYQYTGKTPAETEGWGWIRSHDPKMLPEVLEQWHISIDSGQPFDKVLLLRGVDGIYRPFLTRAMPLKDATGRVVQWFGTCTDISEQQAMQEALRESEARFRAMADSAPAMLWITETDGSASFLSRGFCDFIGKSEDTALGFGWLQAVHPDERPEVDRVFREANGQREPFALDYRLSRADGEYRWVIDTGRPRFGSDGTFQGYIGSVIDITDRKASEDRQRLLLEELNHRVKNMLAIIQSIATQTLRNKPDPAAFRVAFSARIAALASAHSLLTKALWKGVSLDEIIVATLAPFRNENQQQAIRVEGPPVVVAPNAAVTLSLVIHELATNAMKYGALSRATGRVDVLWKKSTAEGERPTQVELVWQEHGGPSVSPPASDGFGTRLIKASADQLGGTIELSFPNGGVECQLVFPLTDGIVGR